MREIKLRAWDKKTKEMINDIWIAPEYGWELFSDNDAMCERERPSKNQIELMQWTGLTDKNNVKIYEGDLVRIEDGDDFPIIFKQGTFCYQIGMAFYDFTPLGKRHQYEWTEFGKSNKVEVVGNIYKAKL